MIDVEKIANLCDLYFKPDGKGHCFTNVDGREAVRCMAGYLLTWNGWMEIVEPAIRDKNIWIAYLNALMLETGTDRDMLMKATIEERATALTNLLEGGTA